MIFSAVELGYLARLLGGRFPGVESEGASGPSIHAELARRGVLDDSGAVADEAVRAALRCALTGNILTVAASDGRRACSVSFFVAPSCVVRHELDEAGLHVLELADLQAARAHLEEVARAVGDAPSVARGAVAVDYRRVAEVARLVAGNDEAQAHATLPEAPGYVDALSELRLVATATAHALRGDEIRMTGVGVVLSPSHGSWLVDMGAGGDDEVSIGLLSGSELARRLDAMIDDVAA